MEPLNTIKLMLPDEFSDHLEILDILPIIVNDDQQMLIPYQITIK